MATHYSYAQEPNHLNNWAKQASKKLVEFCQEKDVHPILVYTGLSGVASATALSIKLHENFPEFTFSLQYVRKHGESSHGTSVERNTVGFKLPPTDKSVNIFVDDFVDDGDTFIHCIQEGLAENGDCWKDYLCILSGGEYSGGFIKPVSLFSKRAKNNIGQDAINRITE